MIVATAGHIDHGKTALVKALTGVDADRLPEEKRRGLTIDLGFAYRTLPDGAVLGFVDVPGHERFVRTMLAGVAAVDFALLVIAADDGPMPQTEEHLAILDLLGVSTGAVALTKVDRVSPARVEEVIREIRALIDGTSLAAARILPVSSITGEGVPELAALLEGAAHRLSRPPAAGHFRLAVDRCFVLKGTGIVVTGAAVTGSAKVGDHLVLSPSGIEVRLRGLHAQNRATHAARAGERCALNLTGTNLAKDAVRRGDWIVAPPLHTPTDRMDVRVRVPLAAEKRLADRAAVHLHLGAEDVTGRLALLEAKAVEPGNDAWAQLVLDRPIGALQGDRFVLRDHEGRHTVAGGHVVDPFPVLRGRHRPERLRRLAALDRSSDAEALAGLLQESPMGVDLPRFVRARNLGEADAAALARRVPLVRAGETLALAPAAWESWLDRLEQAMRAWHAAQPESPGLDPRQLGTHLAPRPPAAVLDAAVRALVGAGRLLRNGATLHAPGHALVLAPGEADLWARMQPLIEEGGLRPPRVRELAEAIKADPKAIEAVLRRAGRQGRVLRVADNRWFPPAALQGLAELAEALAREAPSGRFTAAEFKERSGIGRNVAIQVLEFFDKRGFTRREGEARLVARSAAALFSANDQRGSDSPP